MFRPLPHDVSVERALLGGILMDCERALPMVMDRLMPEHFAVVRHGEIYRTIVNEFRAGRVVDPYLLAMRLPGDQERAGAELLALLADAVIVGNSGYYADRIIELAMRRGIIAHAQETINLAYDTSSPVSDVAHHAAEAAQAPAAPFGRFEARQLPEIDAEHIPPRPWLLGTTLIRGEVTILAGTGGKGKSTVAIGMMMDSTSCPRAAVTGMHVFRNCRWLYLHMEESDDEFARRIAATMRHHEIIPCRQNIFHYGGAAPAPIVCRENGDGGYMCEPALDALATYVRENRIDVVCVDPFVMTFEVNENDTKAMDFAVRRWKHVATTCNCAVMLIDHVRKSSTGESVNQDAVRGAGSKVAAARITLLLRGMTSAEAQELGIHADERKRYIALSEEKANMSGSAGDLWFRLFGVSLGNASADYPHGDTVATVCRWSKASATDTALSAPEVQSCVDEMENAFRAQTPYVIHANSGNRWAGWLIMEMTNCNKDGAKAKLRHWMEVGLLREERFRAANGGCKMAARRGHWRPNAEIEVDQ
jgi:hypothetical protein